MERSTSSRAMSAPWKTKTAKFGTLELKRPEDQSPKASSSSHLSPSEDFKDPRSRGIETAARKLQLAARDQQIEDAITLSGPETFGCLLTRGTGYFVIVSFWTVFSAGSSQLPQGKVGNSSFQSSSLDDGSAGVLRTIATAVIQGAFKGVGAKPHRLIVARQLRP